MAREWARRRRLRRLLTEGEAAARGVARSACIQLRRHTGTGTQPKPGTVSTGRHPASGQLDTHTCATRADGRDTADPAGYDVEDATIMIIRHAEKPDDGTPHGVRPDGTPDKHSLTAAGGAGAGALAELFASARRRPPKGLRRPDAVYAALGGRSGSLRPVQTVVPLAARLGRSVITRYGKGAENQLAAELAARGRVTLVCWQHKSIPDIVSGLGCVTPAPPTSWPRSRYDLVWLLTRNGDAWRFSEVPQQLLAGDSQ